MAVRIKAKDYEELAAKMKVMDRKARTHLRKRVREAGKPFGEAIANEGPLQLPQRGGLRAQMLANNKVVLSQTQKGVRIVLGRKGAYPAGPNRTGWVRHPIPNTSGSRGGSQKWAGTRTVRGTWDKAFYDRADEATEIVSKVLDDIIKELT